MKISRKDYNLVEGYIKDAKYARVLSKLDELTKDVDDDIHNTVILQTSRYNQLKRNERLGITTNDEAGRTKNKILYSLLSILEEFEIADESEDENNNLQNNNTMNYEPSAEDYLRQLINANKRILPTEVQAARDLLTVVQEYKNRKAEDKSYDLYGTSWSAIKVSMNKLSSEIDQAKRKIVLDNIERIKVLIDSAVPTYNQLDEAYTLCQTYGFTDSYIDRVLSSRPNDNNANITIADKIESFLPKIKDHVA